MADLGNHHEGEFSGEEEVDDYIEEAHEIHDEGVDEDEGEEYEEGVEEYDEDEDADGEIADDEEDQPAAGGAGGGGGGAGAGGAGQQMVYIPGLGYIPLANLGNLGGLLGGGGAPGRGPVQQQPDPEGVRPWTSLRDFPAATQEGLLNALNALREDGRRELTVLLLGKGGVGKSSTVNSLLHERTATVAAFQTDTTRPVTFSRASPSSDFTLHVIDTPSLLEQDSVSDARLAQIGKALETRGGVDAVLFLDRLDNYSLSPMDKKVIEGISRVLGSGIWRNSLVCFSRASESSAPPGVDFHDFVAQRAEQVRAAIRKAGAPADCELPCALIENSSRCPTNEDGEKVVPGELPWIVDLVEKIAEVALNNDPFEYSQAAAEKASNPNRRRKWLIPLVLAAQVALKLLLDRVMDDDGCKGDSNGPFDPQTVKERREELKREREERQRRAAKAKASSVSGGSKAVASFVEDEFGEGTEEDEDDF